MEQRLEETLSNVRSLNDSIIKIKYFITYLKDKNHESKKKYKNHKTLATILVSVDKVVVIGATTTSVRLLVTGVGLIVVTISVGFACALSLGDKILQEIFVNNYNKFKKPYRKDQRTNRFSNKMLRKILQDSLIDENEHESLRKVFTNHLGETKFFSVNKNIKTKFNLFSYNKIRFNIEVRSYSCSVQKKKIVLFYVNCVFFMNCSV